MYYILHGEDEFSRTEEIGKMRAKMGDPAIADLSIVTFDGRKLALSELRHACDSVPFLSDKRLVIVEGMLARLEPHHKKGGDEASEAAEAEANPELAKGLKDYLPHVPDTTRLVFVEAKTLAKNNPVLKQAETDKKNAHIREFQLPKDGALPGWIQRRVQERGGAIEPAAVQELATHVGADLRLLDNEIQKLMAYGGDQPIRAQDVRELVASVREANIFDLVDAIGARQTSVALNLLHAQLGQQAVPLYLLTMITRQFRMMLQIQDLRSRGLGPAEIRAQLKLHPFVIDKTSKQAANFSIAQLESAYRRLLDTDLAIKTSRSDPIAALDLLVVDLTRR